MSEGDEIGVGDVEGGSAVAAGRGARASVTNINISDETPRLRSAVASAEGRTA